jgi:hypothetical protein
VVHVGATLSKKREAMKTNDGEDVRVSYSRPDTAKTTGGYWYGTGTQD